VVSILLIYIDETYRKNSLSLSLQGSSIRRMKSRVDIPYSSLYSLFLRISTRCRKAPRTPASYVMCQTTGNMLVRTGTDWQTPCFLTMQLARITMCINFVPEFCPALSNDHASQVAASSCAKCSAMHQPHILGQASILAYTTCLSPRVPLRILSPSSELCF
jgi:hypothetical protein